MHAGDRLREPSRYRESVGHRDGQWRTAARARDRHLYHRHSSIRISNSTQSCRFGGAPTPVQPAAAPDRADPAASDFVDAQIGKL